MLPSQWTLLQLSFHWKAILLLWHFRMWSTSPRDSPIDLLSSHVWVFQTAAKIIMNLILVFSLVTCLHPQPPPGGHLHLWLNHVLISLNTSTHNGFPAVSMRICQWPTFSLISLCFLVPWTQFDKLLVLESSYICCWKFDLGIYYYGTDTLPWGPLCQLILPEWKNL